MWTHDCGPGLDVCGQVSLMVKWVNQLLEQAVIIVIIMGTYRRSTTNALVTYLIALMINSKSRNQVCAEEMRAYAWPRHLHDLRPLLSDFLPHPPKVPLSLRSTLLFWALFIVLSTSSLGTSSLQILLWCNRGFSFFYFLFVVYIRLHISIVFGRI